jgi:hypothetical protein
MDEVSQLTRKAENEIFSRSIPRLFQAVVVVNPLFLGAGHLVETRPTMANVQVPAMGYTTVDSASILTSRQV